MKLHRLLLAVAAVGLLSLSVAEARGEGFPGRAGLTRIGGSFPGGASRGGSFRGGSLFGIGGYGRGPASLYSLGRMFVPPHFAVHPPVYYSLPQGRPYGHSPFAHSGDYYPEVVVRRIVVNPHIQALPLPEPVESPTEVTTSTVRVIVNPYYSPDNAPESSLASQAE